MRRWTALRACAAFWACSKAAVTGMADGYGRMAGKPAFTLLHLGPGLSNASANIHNAKRAGTPMINVVGDHATYHLEYDAPLASDIAGLAKPVSHWYHSTKDAKSLAGDGARAVAAAMTYPGQIATLTVPANCAWDEADRSRETRRAASNPVRQIPHDYRRCKDAEERQEDGVADARACAAEARHKCRRAHCGGHDARLVCDTFISRIERGAGCVKIEKMPYFAEDMVEFLKGTEQLILVGTKPPVSFFAYPGKPGWLTPEGCETLVLTTAAQDGVQALEALASELNAPLHPVHVQQLSRPRTSHRGAIQCAHHRRGAGRTNAGKCGCLGRGGDIGFCLLCADRRNCAGGLAQPDRRLHRTGHSAGGGRGGGLPRSQGGLPQRRWRRHVHATGVVDHGA